jgi:hypothetical protein
MDKIILLEPTKKEKNQEKRQIKENKIPLKRVITDTKQWNSIKDEISYDKQKSYIQQLYEKNIVDKRPCKIIIQQMKKKIHSYRAQDILKGKFNSTNFIDIETILGLLHACKNQCYYCKNEVNVLYENVREPRQWSLDRIENEEGHNRKNVLIACLSCNLHRKLMYTERYAFTKQLNIIKQNETPIKQNETPIKQNETNDIENHIEI